MVDQTRPEIAQVQAINKARIYQKRKLAEEQIKKLLDLYSSDMLIDLIMKVEEEK
tara:strand:- start:380 stop:544 length:165 start_codon:yes stop_codon:yes gene_type:complete